MNYFLFQVKVLEKKYDLSDPEEKTQFFREIAAMLLEFPEELERNNYMETLSRLYRIQYEDLRKMVNHMALSRRKALSLYGRGRDQEEERK